MGTSLEQAISHIKSGDKAKGKTVLIQIIKDDPRNENAWLWMSKCVNSLEQKKDCFQRVIAINPQNQIAKNALRKLESQTPNLNAKSIASKSPISNKDGNTNIKLRTVALIFFACIASLLVLVVFIRDFGIIATDSTQDVIQSTPTRVPYIIDFQRIRGLHIDQIRAQYPVTHNIKTDDMFSKYTNIVKFSEDYEINNYSFAVYFDEDYISCGIYLKVIRNSFTGDISTIYPGYKYFEWVSIGQMLNFEITRAPDEVVENKLLGGNALNIWWDMSGYRIELSTLNNAKDKTEFALAIFIIPIR